MRVRTACGPGFDRCLSFIATKNLCSATSSKIVDKRFRLKFDFPGKYSVSRGAGGAQVSAPVQQLSAQGAKGSKEYDVVALGNLCVDVVVQFDEVLSFSASKVIHVPTKLCMMYSLIREQLSRFEATSYT